MTAVDDLRARTVWPLVISTARLENARRVADTASRLGRADRRLLWLLADERPRSMREIAEELGLDLSTISRQITHALEDDLIEKHREPGRSSHQLTLTASGLQRFRREAEGHVELHEQALAALPAEDHERFIEMLRVFADSYAQHAGEPSGARGASQ